MMTKKNLVKVLVTIPSTHTDAIIAAMAAAGAGTIGKYTHCAFITHGTGNYMPTAGANPYIGKASKMSREPEDKVEMICAKTQLNKVLAAALKAHPYESPTIDVIEIQFYSK